MKPQLVIVDGNAPWVRSLFLAMRDQVDLFFLRVYNIHPWKAMSGKPLTHALRWRQYDGFHEQYVPVAGWTRYPRISTAIVAARCRTRTRRFGAPLATVYTFPNYAGVLPHAGPGRSVYFAHDPFTYFVPDPLRIAALEEQMLRSCDITMAVSRALVEDFTAKTSKPVFWCPNAVDRRTIDAGLAALPARPQDLPQGAIVGCVGQINDTFDWPLIEQTAAAIPGATFVFIGPLIESDPEKRQRIENVLRQTGNLLWLGARPHEKLVDYVRHFNICLSPLRMSAWNDRRSPLRFYDYLATDRPIVTTAVAEAFAHGELLSIGRDAVEIASLIRAHLEGRIDLDLNARRRYILDNTWQNRGRQFLQHLNAAGSAAGKEGSS